MLNKFKIIFIIICMLMTANTFLYATTTPVSVYIDVTIDEPSSGENYGVGDDVDVSYTLDGSDGIEYDYSITDYDNNVWTSGGGWTSSSPKVCDYTWNSSGVDVSKNDFYINVYAELMLPVLVEDWDEISVGIIEIEKIQYDDGSGLQDMPSGTLTIRQGETVSFYAVPNPYYFPANFPTWTGVLTADDDGVDHMFNDTGNYSFTVTFGNSITHDIEVISDSAINLDHIEYFIGSASLTEVPTDTLYVSLNSDVTFYAIPAPSTVSWPAGEPAWGGEGAGSTGEDVTITFSDTAATTISATYNGITKSVNIEVIDSTSITLDRMDYNSNNGGSDTETPDTLTILQGSTITFIAIPDPESAAWPTNFPEWYLDATPAGTGKEKDITFSDTGMFTVKVEYNGVSIEKNITVVDSSNTTAIQLIDIEYSFDNITYTSMPSVLYAYKGDKVYFKAIPIAGTAFPIDEPYWSGCIIDNGCIVERTFSTVILTNITANFGGISISRNIQIFDFSISCLASSPTNKDRTTIGIGEELKIIVEPTTIEPSWDNTSEKSVFGLISGNEAWYFASYSPEEDIVELTIGNKCVAIPFKIIEPEAIKYFQDIAFTDAWFVRPEGPPDNYIGVGRIFPICILPTTVSFYNISFRENVPEQNFYFPSGDIFNIEAEIVEFGVDYDNGGATDKISSGVFPFEYLISDDGCTAVTFSVVAPLEYKNNDNNWIEFVDSSENVHEHIFTDTGACQAKAIGNNTKQSDFYGPWQ